MALKKTVLKKTSLYDEHAKLNAHFTDFGGWEMPLRYASELDEHRAVRQKAGLFDLSHMGEVWVTGPETVKYLNSSFAGNFQTMAVGRAKYTLFLNEHGGIVDDLIAYRLAENKFLVVPNAGNAAKVVQMMQERATAFDVQITDATKTTSLIALQGPKSAQILLRLMTKQNKTVAENMKYYAAAKSEVAGHSVLIARTGYTGEDGFELYLDHSENKPDAVTDLWNQLLNVGEPDGILPAGLASRDSLRLEAGMPLYGNELNEEITPIMANLGGVVSFKKGENFAGRKALENSQESARVLVALRGLGRRAARNGYLVVSEGEAVGEVTSGLPSPTLGYPIALAYVDRKYSAPGTALEVDLRGKPQPFEVVTLPFYKREA